MRVLDGFQDVAFMPFRDRMKGLKGYEISKLMKKL